MFSRISEHLQENNYDGAIFIIKLQAYSCIVGVLLWISLFFRLTAEAYPEPCQSSKMERFERIVNG